MRAFSAASSKATSDVGPQDEGRTGGIEGIVLKTLIIGTILAVALKLGPHIGVLSISSLHYPGISSALMARQDQRCLCANAWYPAQHHYMCSEDWLTAEGRH